MARQISQLTAAGAVTPASDVLWIEQGGLPRKITVADLTSGGASFDMANNTFLRGENAAGGTFYDLIGLNSVDWVEIGDGTRNVQYDGALHKFSATQEIYQPAGGQSHLIRSNTNWTAGTLFVPGIRWQENDGTSHGGIRAYTTTGTDSVLQLGTGWLDSKLELKSSNAHSMTGSLTLTGTLAANTVTGINVTSGVDPGHTHSAYLTSYTETDTLASVTGRGNTTTANVAVDYIATTGLGPLTTPGTDDTYVGGYGIMGSRATAFYVSNVAGPVKLNYGAVHGSAVKLETTATGVTVTGDIAASNIPAYNVFTGGSIVTRHSSGYIFTNYLNMTANDTTAAATQVAVETSNDGYLRWQTPATLMAKVGPRYAQELSNTVDLNTLNASNEWGFYYQTANADTTGNNYPNGHAGSLLVQGSAGNMTQMYITYPETGNKMFFRSWYNGASPGAWHEVATRDEAQTFTGALTLSSDRLNGNSTLQIYGNGTVSNLYMSSTQTQISSASAVVYHAATLSSTQMGTMRHEYHTGTLYPTGFATMPHINTTTTSFTTLASLDNFWHRKFRFTGTTNTTLTLTNDSTVPAGAVMWLAGYGGTITVQQGTGVTIYFYDGAGGTLKTGTRTIAKTGWATLHRISSTAYEICGIGVT